MKSSPEIMIKLTVISIKTIFSIESQNCHFEKLRNFYLSILLLYNVLLLYKHTRIYNLDILL
jgi:hypothetical protein